MSRIKYLCLKSKDSHDNIFLGKSTLSNVLIGEDVNCQNCSFTVCDGHDSCTKETTYAVGHWLGDGDNFTIVDTPGFGDSDNDDNILIDEMMRELFNKITNLD